jgi:hypothetical protein
VADQVFSTIQIPVNQWRWLPVSCIEAAGGSGRTGVLPTQVDISFIRYGELAPTAYNPAAGFDFTSSTVVGNFAAGVSTIKLLDTSSFPPDNGKIVINPGGGTEETIEYSYNNVSTGELTLVGTTANLHNAGETVERVDWVEVSSVIAPGSYLLLLTPIILNTPDLFTYIVTNITGGGALFEPYTNTIDIIGGTDPVTFTPPSLATCKLYGFVLDLAGNAVQNSSISARLLAVPSTTNNAGLADTTVSAKTDANGYFEFTVVQGATVDVIVPDIGYRRTIVVPSTTLAKLFELA